MLKAITYRFDLKRFLVHLMKLYLTKSFLLIEPDSKTFVWFLKPTIKIHRISFYLL